MCRKVLVGRFLYSANISHLFKKHVPTNTRKHRLFILKKKQTNKQNKTKQETKQSNEQDMAPMNQLVNKKEIYGYFTYSISV